jgi:hypothetical protein
MPEADGAYVTAPAIYDPRYLLVKRVREKYESTYGKPFNHYAANGYDFVRMIGQLLEGQNVDRENVRSILAYGYQYTGILGNLTVRKGERDIAFPLYPARIIDGEIRYLR